MNQPIMQQILKCRSDSRCR